MFNFFVSKKENDYFFLSDDILKHIQVVRLKNENIICVYEKKFYECFIENNKAKIIREIFKNHEFDEPVIIAIAIIEIKNLELLIKKSVELGATEIVPFFSCNVSKKSENINLKIERWKKIVESAAEQSFRNIIPKITVPIMFEDVIKKFKNIKNKFIAYEKCSENVEISFPQNSIFLIGPEGGFTDLEIEIASKENFKVISLGKRILRSETAAFYVLSKII